MVTGEPPEFYAFLLSNLLTLALGGTITGLSYRAYRRAGESAFGTAAAGFGLITLGSVVEGIYELGIRGYELSGRELLALHTVEGVVIALGLATLFYSVTQY
ncbi:DUF7521 family protein [Salinirubrum litoreum]|uniref:Uncharacterized protein n=1 Tax=Salinirubrum litoreum TaxID=1126234 RepID=A0ABD5R8E9_9EURY|nr:hypothetical protein [Salinirubrum litoreum]